jgi:two-component system sensor histidine kinase BaeS
MRSLRSRLILTHLLPLLVVIPLLGLAFYFAWSSLSALSTASAVLTPSVESIKAQAELIARLAGRQGDIWSDPAQAQALLRDLRNDTLTLTLLDDAGQLLATAPLTNTVGGASLARVAEVSAVLRGEDAVQVVVTTAERAQTVRIVTPIRDPQRQLLGVLLVSHEVAVAEDVIGQVILLLGAAVFVLLATSVGIGLWLSLRLNDSLRRATAALHDVATGQPQVTLPDQGIREIDDLYQAVNGLVERLRTLEAARQRLLANLVHELGRPLGSLRAAIYALRQGAAEEPELRNELLAGIDAQIDRLEPLLGELTELHAQVLGPRELERTPTPLTPWLTDLAVVWRAAAEQKGIAWRSDIPLDLPSATIDARQLARAVGNLLSNAVKFTPAGGTIQITARVAEDEEGENGLRCVIRVRDSGPGIDPADQARIFEPFQRGTAQQRFPQGMGLGLTIARDIVAAHGGGLTLASEPGQGSEFTIEFPLGPP